MRTFPENLATFEQNNIFYFLIWDRAHGSCQLKWHEIFYQRISFWLGNNRNYFQLVPDRFSVFDVEMCSWICHEAETHFCVCVFWQENALFIKSASFLHWII